MKRALREIADHNTAGSNDAPATARAGRRRTRSATRRAAEEEPSAPAPAAPPRRRRRRAPAPAPAEPELPGSDDVVPAPAPAPAPAQPPAPAPQQVVDLTRDDDAADTPAAAPPPPPAPAPAPPAPAQPPAPPAPPQVDQQPARHRNVFGYAATTVEPPPTDRRHLASKRAPAPGRGATIVGVRSTKPRDPLAAALRPAPKRPKKRSARERLAAAQAPRASTTGSPARRFEGAGAAPPRPAPPPPRLAPARAPPGAAPPPRQLASPDPRQTCDACGAPACLETDRGGAACLYHWFAGAAFRRGRSRVVARDRIDAAAPRVEGAWQRAFARAAEAVGVEAAKRLAERQQAPDDDDPFGALLGEAEASRRKPTRPTQLYARKGEEIVVTRDEDRADGWPCVACGSCRTDREPLGGGNLQTHKTETWGSKDAPDSMWAVSCRACGHEWRTEG